MPLLDAHDPDRPHHLLVRDGDHALRGRPQRPERARRPRRSASRAAPASRRRPPAIGTAGLEPAQARRWRRSPSAGARRGRRPPAPDRRPRSAARRATPRPRRATRSSRRPRRRCGCRRAARGPGGRRSSRCEEMPRLTVADQADVRRRPAHVEADRLARRPAPTRRRPRRQGPTGAAAPGAPPPSSRRAHAAARLHHVGLGQAALGGRSPQAAQVAAGHRAQVGVGDRRRRPLVLPELGRDVDRRDDVDAGQRITQAAGHLALVAGVGVGVEQAHRDRLDARAAGAGAPPARPMPGRAGAGRRRARTARRPPR